MKQRIFTAIFAGAVALAALLAPIPEPLVALAAVALVVGLYELAILIKEPFSYVLTFGLIGICPLFLVNERLPLPWTAMLVWLLGILSVLFIACGQRRIWPLASFWIAGSLGVAIWLHRATAGPNIASSLLLLTLLPLWVGDSAAYFVGRAFGKTALAPKISPKKTWEGAIANLAGCLAAAWGVGFALGVPLLPSLLVGASTGILGQAGDLLESWLKRSTDTKDSGSILPGHGGILDRLDSFLASGPVSAAILVSLAPELFHVKPY